MPSASIVGRLELAALRRRAPLWVAAMLPWVLLLSPVGVALCGAWIWWDYRRLHLRIARQWSGWLDDALPWLEDSSTLLVQADGAIARMQRARILARVQADLRADVIDGIVGERVRFDWRIVGASTAAALALFGWARYSDAPVTARTVLARLGPTPNELTVRVTPPRYTGAAGFASAPRDLTVAQFSTIEWCLRNPRQGGKLELGDGSVLPLGPRCARWSASGPMLWRWRGQRFDLRVRPDRAPQIAVGAPRTLVQVLPEDEHSAAISLRVHDDYRVRRATLHLLLARAEGQALHISEREVNLPESKDPRTRHWSRQWRMADLGMEPGDELYFYVRALDNAAVPHTSTSPVYTLRLPGPLLLDGQPHLDSLRLQGHVDSGIDSLRAHSATGAVGAEAQRASADSLAAVQAVLRERYAGYSEATGDVRFPAGARPLVRRALAAMEDTELALRELALARAHAASNKALRAVTELQQAERIALYRGALPGSQDSGAAAHAAGASRAHDSATQAMPAPLRRLMLALSSAGPLPDGWQRTAHDWLSRRSSDSSDSDGGAHALAAQRAMQDVADGCHACRASLRAYLRQGAGEAAPALQIGRAVDTAFARAWQGGAAP